MRAAVLRNGELRVRDDVPDPEPGFGQVLVEVAACGICGSDLHFAKHGHTMLELGQQMEGVSALDAPPIDLAQDVFMGHEFCAEIVEHGPGTTRALPVGARVCSRPVLMRPTGPPQTIGYSNEHPGGYGEYMRLCEELLL